MNSSNPSRDKILVVGRRGVGKLSLVQSILGTRLVPTTSASRSRPSSPLILPAVPVPTLEETDDEADEEEKTADAPLTQMSGETHWTNAPPTKPTSHSAAAGATASDMDMGELGYATLSSSQPDETSTTTTATRLHHRRSSSSASSTTTSTTSATATNPTTFVTTSTPPRRRPKVDHSGVTIPWTIDTKYYSVQVDFWIDETDAQGCERLEQMIESGELDEMGGVVEAVVFCFSKNQPSGFHDIKPWLSFVERFEPSITLCIATDAPVSADQTPGVDQDHETIDDYDDWCLSNGFEYIDLQEQPQDPSQNEHVGLDRVMEALAAHLWDGLKRKSTKARGQYERSMMLSFQDDDPELGLDGPFGRNSTQPILDSINGFGGEDFEDEEEDDEDDDRVFYKALAELNLHNRCASPTAPGYAPPMPQPQLVRQLELLGDGRRGEEAPDYHQRMGFTDLDDVQFDVQSAQPMDSEDLDIWSSQDSMSGMIQTKRRSLRLGEGEEARRRVLMQQQALLRYQDEVDDVTRALTDSGGKDAMSSLSLSSTSAELEISNEKEDFSFELDETAGQEFEFGEYVVATEGPGGEELSNVGLDELQARLMSSSLDESSVHSMHQTLFANIDEDDGMAQTVETLRGLREQGKHLPEHERRELAARVALSFGMHFGQ